MKCITFSILLWSPILPSSADGKYCGSLHAGGDNNHSKYCRSLHAAGEEDDLVQLMQARRSTEVSLPESVGADTACANKQERIKMHLWVNYSISLAAFGLALWCWMVSDAKTPWMLTMAMFHAFFGVAALFGGFEHSIEANPGGFKQFCGNISDHTPQWLTHVDANEIRTRCWYVSMLGIILSEYELFMTFLWPYASKHPWVMYYMRGVVVFGSVWQLVNGDYNGVVICHVLSHTVGIAIAFVTRTYGAIPIYVINLAAGLVWGFMKYCMIPSGPLHYNDWYHGYCTIFQFVLQWYIEWSGVVHQIYESEVNDAYREAPVTTK